MTTDGFEHGMQSQFLLNQGRRRSRVAKRIRLTEALICCQLNSSLIASNSQALK